LAEQGQTPSLLLSMVGSKESKEEVKFTFNVAKFDKIFDDLLKSGNIKMTHNTDELKR
jgi:ribosome maturation protein Sdo1